MYVILLSKIFIVQLKTKHVYLHHTTPLITTYRLSRDPLQCGQWRQKNVTGQQSDIFIHVLLQISSGFAG